MKIAERLKVTADKVKPGSFAADIGTDHAYIPIYIIKTGICDKAIATDVRTGPLERAKTNVRMYGLENNIELKQGWGLEPVYYDNIDCAILAGMGGYLICNILMRCRQKADKIDYFVLQPMQFTGVIRKYLYCNGFRIYDESLVKENNKIFEIIAAEHGHDNIDNEIYYDIGKSLIDKKDPLLGEFIQKKMDEINCILEKINPAKSDNGYKKIQECRMKLDEYEKILKYL